MKKGYKLFLTYFFTLILILVAIVIISLCILYFFPGTNILGYKYIVYSDTLSEEIGVNQLNFNNAKSFKVEADNGNVVVRPNSQSSSTIEINYKRSLSGVCKEVDSKVEFSYDFYYIEYQKGDLSDTLILNVQEPTGPFINSSSIIEVLLPPSFYFNNINIECNNGKITFYEKTNVEEVDYFLTCKNLILNSGNNGQIFLENFQSTEENFHITNYLIQTENGTATISNSTSLYAYNFVFNSKRGSLNFTNSSNDATLYVNNFSVDESLSNSPTININKLIGNLDISAYGGSYNFSSLGSEGSDNTFTFNVKNANVNVGTSFGSFSLLGSGNDISNKIYIDSLSTIAIDNNNFKIGSGVLNINDIDANVYASSTSGSISLKQIDPDHNVYVASDSGSINVDYKSSVVAYNTTEIIVITNTGNVNLSNLSGKLKLDILKNNSNALLNISFNAITNYNTDNSIINAKNRKVSITLKGINRDLAFRLLTTCLVSSSAGVTELAEKNDSDYLLSDGSYVDYIYQYRVRYSKNDNGYIDPTLYGSRLLLINCSNAIDVQSLYE